MQNIIFKLIIHTSISFGTGKDNPAHSHCPNGTTKGIEEIISSLVVPVKPHNFVRSVEAECDHT